MPITTLYTKCLAYARYNKHEFFEINVAVKHIENHLLNIIIIRLVPTISFKCGFLEQKNVPRLLTYQRLVKMKMVAYVAATTEFPIDIFDEMS